MGESEREYECNQAKSSWRQTMEWYRRNKKFAAEYQQKVRHSNSQIGDTKGKIDSINQRLYYLNEKITAKKQKIANLKQRIADSTDEYDKKSWRNEIPWVKNEKTALEKERTQEKNERTRLNSKLERLKSEEAEFRRNLASQRDSKRKHLNKLKNIKPRIDQYCDDNSDFQVPPDSGWD